ncbi:Diacylglycerol kinase family enzyme [Vibrio xiamenensis]|uniref:Diacylglycerol kinase family enzyme n=2 Tax=Vibrio xiamenensis TaxID=861298 RepID=A0A1G8CAQ5_9VIBR|nr:Diacylglycerol kinase family enzyme [Vibrio xiamenensis]
MKVAHYYFNGCLLALALAIISPWTIISLLALWTAIALGLVAFAYYKNNGMIFRKRQGGRIPHLVRVLFWPFMFGVQIYNRIVQVRSGDPVIQEIEPGLYLASRLTPMDVDVLNHNKIRAIFDATAEFDSFNLSLLGKDIEYLNIPVLDHSYPDFDSLMQSIRWIDSQRRNGRNVVVHCALGRGRSVFVMAAYLLAESPHKSLDEVMAQIQSIRLHARLNQRQYQALSEYVKHSEFGFAKPPAWIIANPVSGGGKWPENKAQILEALAPYYRLTIKETTESVSAESLAKQAKKKQPKLIIAAGGDGTLNAVASQIVGSDIQMGILPLGTANSLAHALWGVKSKLVPIPLACEVLTQGAAVKIDTAQCNERLALMVVAVGFEQQMIEFANRDEKNDQGQGAYLRGFFNAVSNNQALSLTVKFDGESEQTLQTGSLVIANAAPFSTLLAQGKGQPDAQDGQLDVTWLPSGEKVSDQVWSLTELLFNGLTQRSIDDVVEHRHVTTIEIQGQQGLKYAIDGELFEDDGLKMQVKPNSLWVLVPADSTLANTQSEV